MEYPNLYGPTPIEDHSDCVVLAKKCKWQQDEDGVWDTACGNRFEFNDGGPIENGFEHCPYCGEKLNPWYAPNAADKPTGGALSARSA